MIDLDERYVQNIQLENQLFNDIVQVQLPQQYTLVTYRVMAILDWSARFCRQAKHIFKTDDDVFINSPLLIRYVSRLLYPQQSPIAQSTLSTSTNTTNSTSTTSTTSRSINSVSHSDALLKTFRPDLISIYGYKISQPRVIRDADDVVQQRYVVTEDEYRCSQYPDYLSGFGYLLPKVARDAVLYAFYFDKHPFRISDVYITGILPDYLRINRESMSEYNIRYLGSCETFFNNYKHSFACAVGSHFGSANDVFIQYNKYWKTLKANIETIYSF
ncbi:unnamed protein product [Didymodactylos carnosus]|uniref:Hexosyltransferase n=1 Tax=Didymodactylos carnosus TaxID=1234261 RepID=A0A814ATJ4_9BILA|nr:unnamed protein product [Didymodactylos carnosus]CAF0918211.1 unnamed protein product [Didymodactylos carnosus]CAF3692101.1 unnamed protein product [Didymodactylos carnosus]CAF3698013.1 unnamed protein product [Didymodactylos carnosus]